MIKERRPASAPWIQLSADCQALKGSQRSGSVSRSRRLPGQQHEAKRPPSPGSHHCFVSPTICFGKSQEPTSLSLAASHPPQILPITVSPPFAFPSFCPAQYSQCDTVARSRPRERLYL